MGTTDSITCEQCPRACRIKPGQRGFCFVRMNVDGRLVLTTYGRSTGFCVDPIEKKPLNQFYPGTSVLSFGTAGCNLACQFCQNWTSSRSRSVDAACDEAQPEDIADAAKNLQCRSVAFTYNDPVIWAEYAIDTARACHRRGIKTVAVTAGYIAAEARHEFFSVMDAANVDLKAFREEFYHDLTGGHLEPVKDTLLWLARETDVWLEITNLIIPGANDSPDELREMCDWIVDALGPDVPLHFSAFHPDFKLTDRGATPPETLLMAHKLAVQAGLRYVYTGNVSDPAHQSTLCPTCGEVVIWRNGYTLGTYSLKNDVCGHCNAQIAGRFDATPGDWGTKRMPVRIADHIPAKPVRPQTKGATSVSLPPAETVKPHADQRPQLTPEQEALVLQAAGRQVADVVLAVQSEPLEQVLVDVAGTPLLGAFVSLKRSGQLRSCCGFLGEAVPLGAALGQAAVRAAKEDPRFPPISPSELASLDIEVWLLWGMEPITEKGADRVNAVTIGTHGLQITRGPNRGLLLPGVAIEHKLDAKTFLEHTCRKASLPNDAWLDDNTSVMRFHGYSLSGKLAEVAPLPESEASVAPGGPTAEQVAQLADFCRQNLLNAAQGMTAAMYLPDGFDGNVCGAALSVKLPNTHEMIDSSKLSMRADVPLQSTLFDLVNAAANALRNHQTPAAALNQLAVRLTVLWDPAMQGTLAEPILEGLNTQRRAVMVVDQGKWGVAFDARKSPAELVDDAVGRSRLLDTKNGNVVSFATVSTEPRFAISNVPHPQPGPTVRPPAVAGQFYPNHPKELGQMLDGFLPADRKPAPWAGCLVPHAGWVYSGRLAAEVFAHVEIPKQVIIVAPKHNRGGADWAVAPHRVWSLPGGNVDADPNLAESLAAGVNRLELDAVAHAQEHSIEVQLPILARLAPGSRHTGMVIHGGDLSQLQQAADELAGLISEMSPRPLLVVSTDMNHYANETETRRVDRMAMEAMEDLDPAGLFNTVRDNRISMCGVLPAVLVMETLKRLGSLKRFETVGYRTSAEASGDINRVVGYAGMLFGE